MTRDSLKTGILFQDVEFDYKGVDCAFSPLQKYLLRYGEDRREFDDLDSAIDAPMFDGKSLAEIADQLEW
jgi:hypothetical protein